MEPKGKAEPESYQLELPFNIKSVHPLSRDQYLIEVINDGMMDDIRNAGPSQIPGSGNLFMLKKESSEDAIPFLLSPISQSSASISEDVPADVEFLDKETKNLTNISRHVEKPVQAVIVSTTTNIICKLGIQKMGA